MKNNENERKLILFVNNVKFNKKNHFTENEKNIFQQEMKICCLWNDMGCDEAGVGDGG